MSSRLAVPFCPPTSSERAPVGPCPWHLVVSVFGILAIPTDIHFTVLICNSLIIYDVGHLFLCVQVQFLHVDVQLFQHHLLRALLIHCFAFAPLPKLVNSISKGLFLDSLFCFTDLCDCPFAKTVLITAAS